LQAIFALAIRVIESSWTFTNFAEMATINRFGSSSMQKLPWANLGRPWQPEDFARTRNQDAAKAIAEFAVKAGACGACAHSLA
jgi:hypothetical protein